MTIINIYAPQIKAPKYIKQTSTKLREETDSNTIIVGKSILHSQYFIRQ
jgi:hypothetical protein